MANQMSDKQNEGQVPSDIVRLVSETTMILDKVDYAYVSYAQVSANSLDFRIAFGDRIPPDGHVKPTFGVIMSHTHAKALLTVLAANVPKIDKVLEELDRDASQHQIDDQPLKG